MTFAIKFYLKKKDFRFSTLIKNKFSWLKKLNLFIPSADKNVRLLCTDDLKSQIITMNAQKVASCK